MIKKATVEDCLYDVISEEEYKKNRDIYDKSGGNIAIEHNGFILPIRSSQSDMRPGYYAGSDKTEPRFTMPTTESEVSAYSAINHLIDFSKAKNLRDIIDAQDKLRKSERSILTTADNITIPEIKDDDTPFMKAIKTCILKKGIDLDKYGYRFGNNYPNDKRLLRKPDMTLQKGITYANCLDFDMYLIIKDNNPDVPNPIGETIIVRLTGDSSGFTSEYADKADIIADIATTEPGCLKEAAYTQYNSHFGPMNQQLPDCSMLPGTVVPPQPVYYQYPMQPAPMSAGFAQQMPYQFYGCPQPFTPPTMYPKDQYETYTSGGKK